MTTARGESSIGDALISCPGRSFVTFTASLCTYQKAHLLRPTDLTRDWRKNAERRSDSVSRVPSRSTVSPSRYLHIAPWTTNDCIFHRFVDRRSNQEPPQLATVDREHTWTACICWRRTGSSM